MKLFLDWYPLLLKTNKKIMKVTSLVLNCIKLKTIRY